MKDIQFARIRADVHKVEETKRLPTVLFYDRRGGMAEFDGKV